MIKQKTMQKSRKFIGAILAGVMTFSMVPSVMAAEPMTATLGDKDEFTFVFSSDYETKKAGDKESYHIAADGTVTISFKGDADLWMANYVPSSAKEGGYSIEIDAKDSVTVKFFDSLAKADEFWDNDQDKEILPAYDKTGGSISVVYPSKTGDMITNTIPLSFDGTGSTKASVTPPVVAPPVVAPPVVAPPVVAPPVVAPPVVAPPVVTPPVVTPPVVTPPVVTPPVVTPPVVAPMVTEGKITGTFKSTDGLCNVIPPMPVNGQDLRYTIMPNETLFGIAYNYYGSMSGTITNKIVNANAAYFKSTNGILETGAVITLPAQGLMNPVTVSGISNAAGTYLVKTGDSLAKIAQHFYGNAELWRQIYEANKDRVQMVGRSPMIYDKQWLVIPNVSGSQYSATQAPSNTAPASTAPAYTAPANNDMPKFTGNSALPDGFEG